MALEPLPNHLCGRISTEFDKPPTMNLPAVGAGALAPDFCTDPLQASLPWTASGGFVAPTALHRVVSAARTC